MDRNIEKNEYNIVHQRINNLIENRINRSSEYVLYWMQQSQRVNYNHSLLYAINIANKHSLPLIVLFIVDKSVFNGNKRHYKFMLEGIKEVKEVLEERGINFVIQTGQVLDVIIPLLNKTHTLVMDYGYLRNQLRLRKDIYNYFKKNEIETDLVIVESDLVIPVKYAYYKAAYNAYIFRKSILKRINKYRDFKGLTEILNKKKINIVSNINLDKIDEFINYNFINDSVSLSPIFIGGYSVAKNKLNYFIKHIIKYYPIRNDPSLSIQSYLSMHLHFGQISVLEILDELDKDQSVESEVKDKYIDQLVVRRELSYNFVYYNKGYDIFDHALDSWIYKTIANHDNDEREFIYSLFELENSQTHDTYYNASMKEMRETGFMANYMRMYWAKKIMEWSPSLRSAYDIIIFLSNKYFIDGNDAITYYNIAWCYGKTDRPWKERPIFGTIRYMNQEGLIRKFDMENYVMKVNNGEINVFGINKD